jgi:small subunit ribosomal protein S21
MIIIDVTKFGSIEQALKIYKNKTNKIGTVRELRDRQKFVKPSVKRRAEVLKAKYIEKKFNNNN